MSRDPIDSAPIPRVIEVDRTNYSRADALKAVSSHVNAMLQHQAQAEHIIEQFNLAIELPEKRALVLVPLRCAVLIHTKEPHE